VRIQLFALVAVTAVAACKTPDTQSSSQILNAPAVNNQPVAQGGKVIQNKCNAGGHEGPTTGPGWTFSDKEGCYLDCRNVTALKNDYLKQLKEHRVYGDIATITKIDPEAGKIAAYFADQQAKKKIQMNRFDKLTTRKLFDGADWKKLGIKPGDIFLNMNFGQPNHAGIFYSKRGLSHARLVVEVTPKEILTFDGGWNKFSRLTEVNSQTVWLRPRAKFLKQGDIDNLVKWAKLMEPLDYDNNLTDDWREFREYLHGYLDSGMDHFTARDKAFGEGSAKGFSPKGFQDSFSYQPPSGLYCSEGTAGIYTYLGFRQYGETAIDVATSFSSDESLPDWKLYEDALSGFGADSDKNTYMMHKLFFDYFTVFEAGRKAGVIKIPGLTDSAGATFADAATANMKAVAADNYGASNHIDKQLEDFENALAAAGPTQAQMKQSVTDLRGGLAQIAANMSQQTGSTVNASQAVFNVFYANKSYGPHTFFENGKYFELLGVFYNTNMQGNQALFISDWWLQTFGQPKLKANLQTTLYRIKNNTSLPKDQCVVAEKAPIIPTN
jgi:hypothetical protein